RLRGRPDAFHRRLDPDGRAGRPARALAACRARLRESLRAGHLEGPAAGAAAGFRHPGVAAAALDRTLAGPTGCRRRGDRGAAVHSQHDVHLLRRPRDQRAAPLPRRPGGTAAYWLGNTMLNPATLVFMGFVLGWHWAGLRLALGLVMVLGVGWALNR